MEKQDFFVIDKKINDEIKKCSNWLKELERLATRTTGLTGLVGTIRKRDFTVTRDNIINVHIPMIMVRDLVIKDMDTYSCKIYPLTAEARELLESGKFTLGIRTIVEMKDREYLHELDAISTSLSDVIVEEVKRPIAEVMFFTFDLRELPVT